MVNICEREVSQRIVLTPRLQGYQQPVNFSYHVVCMVPHSSVNSFCNH